jgi:hypothetical protein
LDEEGLISFFIMYRATILNIIHCNNGFILFQGSNNTQSSSEFNEKYRLNDKYSTLKIA